MNIGTSIRTLPTVKPKLYAGKVGTIAVRNEDEIGVLINGRVVWFLEREIEEWNGQKSPSTNYASGQSNGRGADGDQGSAHRMSGQGTATTELPESTPPRVMSTSTREGGLGTQERAREGQGVGARVPGPPRGELGGPQEGTGIDSRAIKPPEGESSPEPLPAPSSPAQSLSGLNPGERGPGGGVVAQCVVCGGMWERPKQRGRPSLKCEGCR